MCIYFPLSVLLCGLATALLRLNTGILALIKIYRTFFNLIPKLPPEIPRVCSHIFFQLQCFKIIPFINVISG